MNRRKKPRSKLEKLTPEELVSLAEKSIFDYNWEYSQIYKIAFKKYNESGNAEKAENMRKEALIFDLSYGKEPKRRFDYYYKGLSEEGKEVIYPDIERDFSEDHIKYYQKRVESTNNPVAKARYADFLWVISNKIQYAKIAIQAYINCAEKNFDNNSDHPLADSLERALSLAFSINNKDLIELCLKECYTYIDKLTLLIYCAPQRLDTRVV